MREGFAHAALDRAAGEDGDGHRETERGLRDAGVGGQIDAVVVRLLILDVSRDVHRWQVRVARCLRRSLVQPVHCGGI